MTVLRLRFYEFARALGCAFCDRQAIIADKKNFEEKRKESLPFAMTIPAYQTGLDSDCTGKRREL